MAGPSMIGDMLLSLVTDEDPTLDLRDFQDKVDRYASEPTLRTCYFQPHDAAWLVLRAIKSVEPVRRARFVAILVHILPLFDLGRAFPSMVLLVDDEDTILIGSAVMKRVSYDMEYLSRGSWSDVESFDPLRAPAILAGVLEAAVRCGLDARVMVEAAGVLPLQALQNAEHLGLGAGSYGPAKLLLASTAVVADISSEGILEGIGKEWPGTLRQLRSALDRIARKGAEAE